MGAPQIILIVLYAITLSIKAHNHGKPREDNHNFYATVIDAAIVLSLLYWGGFFN